MRKATPAVWAIGIVAGVGLAVVSALGLPGTGSAGVAGHRSAGVPSSRYWGSGDADQGQSLGSGLSTVYEGNTDVNFLDFVKQARALPETGHAWNNQGPFGGVVDIPGQGSGNERFGPVDGIGTTIAVDPSDPYGNTAYLGTIGGIFKTTDGGKTVQNVTGPNFARASVGAIAVDPNDPQRVFAGTGVSIFTLSDDAAGTGMYVSNNGGKTWTRPVSNTHGYGINSIAVSRDGTVYAGTTYGLWESTDHGKSFTQVTLPDNATHTGPAEHPMGSWVTSIVISPENPEEVTVAVGYAFGQMKYPDGEIIAPGNGLYRSTNGGPFKYMDSNSQLSWAGSSSDPIGRTSLAYSNAPGGKGVLWALVADAGKTAGNHGCVDTPAIPLCPDGNSELNGVYRSTDDGATWQLEATSQILSTAEGGTTSLAGNAIDYGPGVQGDYNNWILADPIDPNRVYIGLEEAFTGEVHDPTGALPLPSTTWATIEKYADACGFLTYFNTIPNSNGVSCPDGIPAYSGTTTHPDQHSAAFAATPNGFRLYAGNDGGWWVQDAHSVNDVTSPQYLGFNSGSWTSVNQGSTSPATVLPWDATRLQDGSLLLALQDNGVAHVKPDGTSYQVCGGDGVYVFPGANAQSYYCGIDGQTILATTDDMKHTINVTPANNASGATFLSPWTVDPTDSNHLLAAARNVDETDAGPNSNTYDPSEEVLVSSTWQTVFTPPPPASGNWDSSAVYAQGPVDYVAFCAPCRPSLASGSAANAGVVTDKVATNVKPGCTAAVGSSNCWHLAASNGLPHEQVSGIAVDPNDPNTIYVSLRQFIVMGADPSATGTEKVMVSHDGGENFTDLTGNLPLADAHRIAVRDGNLYVATDVGVFTAPVGTVPASWSRFGTGLPQVTYRSMQLDPTGRYLVAGAYGRGGWVYDFGAPAGAANTFAITHGRSAPARSAAPAHSGSGSSSEPRSDTNRENMTAISTSHPASFTGWNLVIAAGALILLVTSSSGLAVELRRRRLGR